MATVDWIFLGVLVASMVVGAWRGLVYEVLSVVSWVAAFVLAQWFAPDVAAWLPMKGAAEPMRFSAGFVLVFIAALFAGSLIAFVIKKMVAAVGLSPIDRVLGAAFGAVRGVVLLLAVAIVAGMTPLHDQAVWKEAAGPQVANSVLVALKPLLPQEFGKYLP